VGKSDYTLKIGFAIPLNEENVGGLPNSEENEQLGQVEDQILQVLGEQAPVVEAFVVTTGTFKEFVFYAKPGLDVKSAHEKLMREIKTHEVQCYAEIDAKWDTYREWVNG
jgi:hypothetical protein